MLIAWALKTLFVVGTVELVVLPLDRVRTRRAQGRPSDKRVTMVWLTEVDIYRKNQLLP